MIPPAKSPAIEMFATMPTIIRSLRMGELVGRLLCSGGQQGGAEWKGAPLALKGGSVTRAIAAVSAVDDPDMP